jgi:hypothetical protein
MGRQEDADLKVGATKRQQAAALQSAGGAPRKLAEGHSPAACPEGDNVAYIFKHQMWRVKLAEGAKAASDFFDQHLKNRAVPARGSQR